MPAFHLYDGFGSGVNAYWVNTDFFQHSNTIQQLVAFEGGYDSCAVWAYPASTAAGLAVLPSKVAENEDFIFEFGIRLNLNILTSEGNDNFGYAAVKLDSDPLGTFSYLLGWGCPSLSNTQTLRFAINGAPTIISVNYAESSLVKLKLRRVSNYLSAYYFNGGQWVQIGNSAYVADSLMMCVALRQDAEPPIHPSYNPGLSYIDFRTGTPSIKMTVDDESVTYSKAPADVLFSIDGFEAYGELTNISSAKWSFGDGFFSSQLSPVHTYGMHGKYNVSCTVSYRNSDGSSETATLYTTFIATKQVNISTLEKCYRVGFYESQGMGPSEFDGTYWPQFPVGIGGGMCYDDNDQPHHIVFDEKYGVFKEISAPNGPDGSGLTKTWTDDDASGDPHEIESEISLAEITGDRKHFQIEHSEMHLYFKPFNEDTRGATGYDENGYRDAQQVDIACFLNGEQMQPNAESLNIPKIGEIIFDRRMIGQRGRMVVNMKAAEYVMTGYDQYWVEKDQAIDISETPNSESDCQLHLSTGLDLWISRGGPNPLFDKVTGSTLSGIASYAVGADSKTNSGVTFTTLGNYPPLIQKQFTWGNAGALSLFYRGTIVLSIDEHPMTLAIHSSGAFNGGWNLGYIPNLFSASGLTAGLVRIRSDSAVIFDFRLGALYAPTAADLQYLYNDVRYNHGDNVCPIW